MKNLFSLLLLVFSLFLCDKLYASNCSPTAGKIMFSQYTETNTGTTPKGIEIWNFSESDINLAATPITIWYAANANTTLGNSVVINSGTFKKGQVIVVGRIEIGNYLSSSGLCNVRFIEKGYSFNGNDYLQLELDGIIQDVIGVLGSDQDWEANGVSTKNQNIALKPGIKGGYLSPPSAYNPSEHFKTISMGNSLSGFGLPPIANPLTTPPSVVSVKINTRKKIEISFSESMAQADPSTNITGLGPIESYDWLNPETLTITLSNAIPLGIEKTVSIDGFYDIQNDSLCTVYNYTFVFNNLSSGLIFSEIMYNPPESGADKYEFIEIYNTTSERIELGGLLLTDGINYSFPNGSFIEGYKAIAIAGKLTEATNFYGNVFLGEYSGTLSNSGESISLINTKGNTIATITYESNSKWPLEADGLGSSLELKKASYLAVNPTAFRASFRYKGTINSKQYFATPAQVHFDLTPSALLTFKDSVFTVSEGDSVIIPVFMRYNSAYGLSAGIEVNSKATSQNDYEISALSTYIKQGTTTAEFVVSALSDNQSDTLEYLELSLKENTYARIGGFTKCRIYIKDNNTPPNICINELMVKNKTTLQHEGKYPQWLEFYNNADTAVSINNWTLLYEKDTLSDTLKLNLNTLIEPNNYYVYFLDSNVFTLPPQFAKLKLFNKAEKLVSEVEYGYTKIDASEGTLMLCENTLSRMSNPTPGYNNGSLGIVKTSAQNTFSLYPQPATETINIKSSIEITSIIITDTSGRKILVKELDKPTEVLLDVSNLKAGIYILLINNTWSKRLVIN